MSFCPHSLGWWSKKIVVVFIVLTFYPISTFIFVVAEVPPSKGSSGNDVNLAIKICREKLEVNPHNSPRIQLSLAQLLESQLYSSNESNNAKDKLLAKEVIELYAAVGNSSQKVPNKIRFESLYRAGRISNDYSSSLISDYHNDIDHDYHPYSTIIRHYVDALSHLITLTDASSVVEMEVVQSLLDEIIPLLLTTVTATGEEYVVTALRLCEGLSPLYPDSPWVDEWMAASLRKHNRYIDAYHSYQSAALKSKNQLLHELRLGLQSSTNSDNNNDNHEIPNRRQIFLSKFIDISVLTASSAREIGLTRDEQLQYLYDAQNYLEQLTENKGKLKNDHGKKDTNDQEPFHLERIITDDALRYDSMLNKSILDLYNQMGIVEKNYGDTLKAANYFLQALEYDSSDGHALVQLASIDNIHQNIKDKVFNVQALNPKYISDLFDAYSIKFESELVGKLEYEGHRQLYNAIVSISEKSIFRSEDRKNRNNMIVIDLGCGTGLLGELLTGYKKEGFCENDELIGVDLSIRMVDIARLKKNRFGSLESNEDSPPVYTKVVQGDMVEYLSSNHLDDSVDLITASDAFIYVGNLENIFHQCRRCLIEGGLLAFTVELLSLDKEIDDVVIEESSSEGMRLLKSGRFGHTRKYIENLATKHGFHVLTWNNCVLRKQRGTDVQGAVAILSKQNS